MREDGLEDAGSMYGAGVSLASASITNRSMPVAASGCGGWKQ
ncbi:MAG: hypothetical protein MAG715_01181 [Methanonatronarchaeales archaeon]|nr:hypothetical protein [Methanonatronarchaeales archaeon]